MKSIISDIPLPPFVLFGRKKIPFRAIDHMTLDEKMAVCSIKSTDENEILQELCQIFFEKPLEECKETWKLCIWSAKVLEQVNEWNKAEAQKLKYEPTPEEIAAGYNDFKVFGDFSTYDAISKRQGISHDAVGKLEYTMVFTMLWKDLMESAYQKKYIENQEKKNKIKK